MNLLCLIEVQKENARKFYSPVLTAKLKKTLCTDIRSTSIREIDDLFQSFYHFIYKRSKSNFSNQSV